MKRIPSYKSGYARSAAESSVPHLWDGLKGLWMPTLGRTGLTLRDVSGNRNHGTLTNGPTWVPGPNGTVIDFSAGTGLGVTAAVVPPERPREIAPAVEQSLSVIRCRP